MWEEVFKVALTNGLFAVLFVALLIYQLKDSAKREKKYQDTIEKLSVHLERIEEIDKDVKSIREALTNRQDSK